MRHCPLVSILTVAIIGLSAPGYAQISSAENSVPPPEGWGPCPRCVTGAELKKAQSEVAGQTLNPRDLNGVWGQGWSPGSGGTFRTPPPLTPWGKERFASSLPEKNAAGQLVSKDTSGGGALTAVNCDPFGWPRLHTNNYGFEFIQLPNRTLQFFERTHTWRTIWTDGRKLPAEPPQLNWMGWNVGRWEGDTFVVESTGYDERSWLSGFQEGGLTHSDEMRVVERWRRINHNTLEVQITVIDPKTYMEPWVTAASHITLTPGAELWEDFCVPSDYRNFNEHIYTPVSAGEKK